MKRTDRPFDCARCGNRCDRYGVGRGSGHPICKSCYLKDLSVPEAVRKMSVIADAVVVIEPQLSRAAIVAAVEASVTNINGLSTLARQVTSNPEVLEGSPLATRSVFRLIAALIEAGAENLSLPRCPSCEREKPLVNSRCDACSTPQAPCSCCGRRKRIHSRTATHEPICKTCHYRDPANWETCSRCGNPGRVNARADDGGAICRRCYRQPSAVCDECGGRKAIASRNHGRALCSSCYARIGPKRACGRCGRVRRIAKRAVGDHPDLCHACWWEPIAVCSRCGTEGMCNGLRKGKPLCLRCRLDDKITATLTGPDGRVPSLLEPVREAVLAVDNPRSGHVWVGRSPAVRVLRDIAQGRVALSHEALDELAHCSSTIHLRDLLVSLGLLPPRDPHVARIERTIARRSTDLSDESSKVLRSFGRWSVLRRARRNADLGRLTAYSARGLAGEVHQAARFLAWMEERGKGLGELSQGDVEQWLCCGIKARYRIRGFVAWAASRGLCPRVVVPALGGGEMPEGTVDHRARWVLTRRLLHDGSIDPADRVVGALAVIYAQRLSDIARLKSSDLICRGNDIYLRLGKEEVLMPGPLGELLRELPWRRQVGISGKLHATGWLFPGRQAGRHQHPEYLRVRLNKLGIDCRATRRAALLQLGSEVPASVLADMLNLAPSTAARWVEWAGGNWTGYVADRIRTPGEVSTGE